MPSPSIGRLVAVFVAGVVLGSVLTVAGGGGIPFGGSPGDGSADRTPDPDSPPVGITTGTGCISPAAANTGWVHEVATGTSRSFTANVTVAHGSDEEVNATFETAGDGVYRLRVDVTDGKAGDPDCVTGSTVEAGASLPTGYERVDVVVDGRTVGSMPNDGDTTADLRTFAWNASTPPSNAHGRPVG